MQSSLIRMLLAASLAVLVACYESEVPLGPATDAPIDADLVGAWVDKKSAVLMVMQFSEHELFARYEEFGDGTSERYRAYITKVGSALFLNVQAVELADDPDRSFIFFRYVVEGDSLQLHLVRDNFVEAAISDPQELDTSTELARFIRRNLNDEAMYEDPLVFYRVGAGNR